MRASAGPRAWLLLLAVLCLAGALGGCVTLPRTAFTAADEAVASPPGFTNVRYTQDDPALADMLKRALAPDPQGGVYTLAISGGGANGAYGAGLLYGWSRTGDRPEFQLVTGISAGALAAPFAFLGSGWDEKLKETYFGGKIRHLLQSRGLFSLLTPGLYSRKPLVELVRAYVTDDLLAAVSAQQAKGRRLLVATTNLDTGQLVVWDMGAIAAQAGPRARNLFAQVLVASASVPGIFPPTMIKVTGAGHHFSEMHVDGQADIAFIAIPETILVARRPSDPQHNHRLYIIVNGQLTSLFAVTPRATIPILNRTIDAVSKASIRSALITTLGYCQQKGCDLSVAAVPTTEKDDPLDFGEAHIESLFSAGQAAAENGRAWTTAAPALSKPAVPPEAENPSPASESGTTAPVAR